MLFATRVSNDMSRILAYLRKPDFTASEKLISARNSETRWKMREILRLKILNFLLFLLLLLLFNYFIIILNYVNRKKYKNLKVPLN